VSAPESELRGVHAIAVPTPFAVGAVNCYVIEGEPLTLVDTGPNSGTSLDALERGLEALGHSVEELELIVLTHQHLDHVGLTEVLQRRSGAEVAGHPALESWLARFPDSAHEDDRWAKQLMRRYGVPEDLVGPLGMVAAAFRPYGSRGRLTRPLADEAQLELGGHTLRVLHRPGHSPTDIVLFDEREGVLLGGDHLLLHISSNAVVSRPPHAAHRDGEPGFDPGELRPERPRSLLIYADSLRQTRALGARLVLGGHGEPVRDPAALIDARLRMQERRAQKILALLDEGPLSAYEVAQRMWGNVAVTQAFLTLSEVLGHVDLLLERGAARESDDGAVTRFEPAR
jgi:glyoxylase-like metal-dependent hydrolase (beta-lactamase superfamily II)